MSTLKYLSVTNLRQIKELTSLSDYRIHTHDLLRNSNLYTGHCKCEELCEFVKKLQIRRSEKE